MWFDGLVTNPDRSPQNPNLLVWHGRPWLIDHGAALYIHHTWRDPDEHARRPFVRIRDHVLLPYAGSIAAADARLAPGSTKRCWTGSSRRSPTRGCRRIRPSAMPTPSGPPTSEYLSRRLETPRTFVEEADRARAAA